ncbi:MAG: N-(5'-phosphoribosyl)anthranilate isomerase [bacterium]|nr:MAG: N-(5'-phosphoribosyl)anthranilate isomerase [bacterium]
MKVKLCGQTRADDIRFSLDSGADLCGVVVEVPSSPRSLNFNSAKPLFAEFHEKLAALTADAPLEFLQKILAELKPSAIQLTADETPETIRQIRESTDAAIMKSLHLPIDGEGSTKNAETFLTMMEKYTEAGVSAFVLDTRVPKMYGGSGVKSDWNLVSRILEKTKAETFLAGGINPQNVLEAAALNPHGIDLASGIEENPGIKSRDKIRALFTALKRVKT